MTNAAAANLTAEIVAATIQHMASIASVTAAEVITLLASGHVNTVRRFNAFMEIATKEARA